MASFFSGLRRRLTPVAHVVRTRAVRALRFTRRHWRLLFLWGAGAFFALGGASLLWAATLKLPDLAALETRRVEQSVQLYDRTGSVLLYDLNQDVERQVVSLAQISSSIKDATLAIEDPGFYEHKGIQPTAIVRAVLNDILSLSKSQGGSTITQQVIKLTVLTRDKSITRKFKEWILALRMEKVFTKDQILELYLNHAPYGGPTYGVEAASRVFFGKHASDVTLPEAAYLAGVLPAPTYYSPWGNHRDQLDMRKNLILDKMYEHGYITLTERDNAKAAIVTFQPQRTSTITAPHFVFYVEQYLEEKYGKDVLSQSGWKITTTLDADLQAKAEEVVTRNALANTEKFNASNAAMVAVDPKSGQVLVMVGSRNYFDTEIPGAYNVAIASRQPGSAFKPFAYAEAFTKGYTPDTVVFDVQTQFQTTCGVDNFTTDPITGCYSPVNYDNLFRGPMTLRNALAQSINIPAIKTLYLAGIRDTLELAKSMGITTLGSANQYGLPLVLGGGEVTLLEMTNAYATFANDGLHFAPSAVLKIEDSNGNVIEDNSQPFGTQVLPTVVAQQINDILSDPVARAPLGGNSLVSFPGRDVAVKTGTTNDYRDAWTIGHTPNLAVGVWAGNNDNSSMVKRVSGFIVGPMWNEFMVYALSKIPNEAFTRAELNPTGLKPQLQGIWQMPGSDGMIHEILYWVDKDNPLGPPPANPADDPQYRFWDPPVARWVAQNGFSGLQQQILPPVQPQQTPNYQTPMGGSVIPH